MNRTARRRPASGRGGAAVSRWALAGLLGGALIVSGCGQPPSQRTQVASYLNQVNAIERQLATPLTAVTKAAAEFNPSTAQSTGSLGGMAGLAGTAQRLALQRASAQIHALRRRLAAIPAPPAAGHLRALLLELVDGQVGMTQEVSRLIAFLPSFQRALAPLGPDTARLEAGLSQQSAYGAAAVAAVFAAKASALRQFQSEVDHVAKQLRALQPPAVSKPGYEAQLSALDGMGASAGRLAKALTGGETSGVGPLLTQFDQAATSNQTAAVQRAQVAAVRSYDARIARLSALSQEVERERTRLANTLR